MIIQNDFSHNFTTFLFILLHLIVHNKPFFHNFNCVDRIWKYTSSKMGFAESLINFMRGQNELTNT